MFEAIRKHSKIVIVLLFLLIIPSFVLVGMNSNYFSEKSPVVARVDGSKIRQTDWDSAHRTQSDRIRAQAPTVDPKLLDSPQARYATLERLVREHVLTAAAHAMRLVTNDARLASSLQEIPEIARLRRADGTLDADAYRALTAGLGLTPEGFEADMRRSLSVNQVMDGVRRTAFGTQESARLALDALYGQREIQLARFNAADFSAKVAATDAELQAYYQAHTTQLQRTEQASVEYLLLDPGSLRAAIHLSEEDLRTYYQENQARLAGKQERRASHILVNAPRDALAAERERAKERAAQLLAQVRKNPAGFAEVAKSASDDKGSAEAGGDLNFFSRGAMVKPFEDAVFALKKGEISDLVETDFGYHIIVLTDVKAPPSFEELRPSLEEELRQQQAQRKFAELAEAFSNAVYEQADSLQAVAEKFQLPLQTAAGVTRSPAPGAQGPLANAQFLQALFAPDALQNKRNTQAVETGPNQLAAGRVTQYTPAATPPFEEVRAHVRNLYRAEKSVELARQSGQAKLAAWKKAPATATGLTAVALVSREQSQNLPRPVIDAALRAPVDALPAWVGVDLGAEGYAVVKVNRVVARKAPDAQRAQQEQQKYQQWLTAAEEQAYYALLKQRFKVQIQVARPQAIDLAGAAEN
ncbi:peptidyl-prolyl cis-trans isomerase [Verminephrobacter aporrectodeae subsp. tuberculatae]|uniref:SurA N-terminal domain-containing protein n=1 Tax=Verminephrobacter aporrectodeae TaxID=1110389 RepID=UPI0022436ED1|nr:SurA N-terminal domain-containing protein [Verminephrobacter aporrectodeae]MCW8208401.1 peptidyl-prolyl cis-trans isomerase [Verminephrobacter aporrectodeae subsp. tuberculatae]